MGAHTDHEARTTTSILMHSKSSGSGSNNSLPMISVDRPPGGTRRSGNKTPRKVQWLDDEEQSGGPSHRGLDEHGLNLQSLQNLREALERHRSQSFSELSTKELSPADILAYDPNVLDTDQKVTRAVPGETYIGQDERAGLPQLDVEGFSQHHASQVVEAHKRGGLFGRFTKSRTRSTGGSFPLADHRSKKAKSKSKASADPNVDIERSAEAFEAAAAMKPGTGILSTLLALYDSNARTQEPLTPLRTSLEDFHGMPPPGRIDTNGSSASTPDTLRAQQPSWSKGFPWGQSRPTTARSGAGVFGALVASTGNISGPAAPAPSTLAPSVKRPGYHLSRYSLESNIPKAPPMERAPSRPLSVHFDNAGRVESSSDSPRTISSSPTPTELMPPTLNRGPVRKRWSGMLKDLPKRGWSRTPTASTPGTPNTDTEDWLSEKEYIVPKTADELKKKDRRRRKRAEVYITRHVAEIIQRQEFICKLARSIMMFGGPSHRLQAQIQATARVLDIELSCMYLPDVMMISFDDINTGTSNIKLIRQGGAFNISKLQSVHELYWKVIHDDISVQDASAELDSLMRKPPMYNKWQLIFFGGMCSASICSVSFNGSFIDSLISFPLGCMLIIIQLFASKHELYSNVFEITVATLFSFLSAALASTGHFCYSAVASSSVVLILPGYIILCGSLELSSHNIVSGAVRVCFSVIYSLFLGFGLAIGSSAYSKLSRHPLQGQDDLVCASTHKADGPWYQRTPSVAWAFLTVPMYSLWLSLRFYAPYNRREIVLLVAISCLGWVSNHFTGTKFPNQSDVSAAVGALAVGFVSNLYARFFKGNAFVIMITGILFQLPSGVANGGLFTFVSKQDSGQSSADVYLSGFQTALQLVSVAIGLTVGLGISLVLVFPIQSRRRAGGIFSL